MKALLVSIPAWLMILSYSTCEKPEDTSSQAARVSVDEVPMQLWYRQPATEWQTEVLPIGNGRLGATIFGGIEQDRMVLNEESIIAGPPIPEKRVGAYKYVEQAREAFFAGNYAECQRIMQEQVMGERISPRSYQPLGELSLLFDHSPEAQYYRRSLDIESAISTTEYTVDGIAYKRTYFSSYPDQVLVVRLEADSPGSLTFTAALSREGIAIVLPTGTDQLVLNGQADHDGKHLGVKFQGRLLAIPEEGTVNVIENQLRVERADSVTLLLAASTDYNFDAPYRPLTHDFDTVCLETLREAAGKGYDRLRDDHTADHRSLFNRVALNLGDAGPVDIPTDERLKRVQSGEQDLGLEALYFQYGRYMLIASSRPGCLPANLQGLWNDRMEGPWNCDYHLNINIQMNYWLSELTNLSECHKPFLDLVEHLVPDGQVTAREVYNCRGFVAHHTTDLWLFTQPFGNVQYGMWPTGGGWSARHFMEHYRFTQDKSFLRERALPILRESALFFVDWLTRDPKTGEWVSGPSTSPENKFLVNGEGLNLSVGPTMDHQIIRGVFKDYLTTLELLDIKEDLADEVTAKLTDLAKTKAGEDGRVLEWSLPFEEQSPGHRHISHLYGLHPGEEIHYQADALFEASRKTIESRLAAGGGHTGWSRAWIINFWARLLDAETAYENLQSLFEKSTVSNLFDTHPPFQIDGNFGAVSGIVELLLQSHVNELYLLPALPRAWSDGQVKGLRGRGAFEIDMEWENGHLQRVVVLSEKGGRCQIRYQGDYPLVLTDSSIIAENLEPHVIAFETKAGASYELLPGNVP